MTDTSHLRDMQNKLLQWDQDEFPLAPLTNTQREALLDLEESVAGKTNQVSLDNSQNEISINNKDLDGLLPPLTESTVEFLKWYERLGEEAVKSEDAPYNNYYVQLEERRTDCLNLTTQIDATLEDLKQLINEYDVVSTKTNALHVMSEQLLADQTKLFNIGEEIKQKLHYFTQMEQISQRLSSPTMSVGSEQFFSLLAKIDACLDYMKEHSTYKDAHTYLVKYRHCQSRAISLVRSYVTHVLNHATQQVLSPDEVHDADSGLDTAFAVYFGKFQVAAPKLRSVIQEIENRAEKSEEYASLLADIQQEYAARRRQVAGAPTAAALAATVAAHARDHCTLLRSACSLLAHATRDECALYQHFFSNTSQALDDYLQSLCMGLYDTMRPHIIHINHLETLAELCAILKVEVLEEQVNDELSGASALGRAAAALLQDTQERLVFRAHVQLRADVLHYKPAPGDLAYPDRLLMMEQIAISIQEQQSLKRSDSRNSLMSEASATSQEVASINRRPQASPADLHGMWYPAVRRTLAALSRLYRCLEPSVFQGLAQEAVALCVASVGAARQQIAQKQTNIDGELFEIKHLLILREQISPFQVDFIIKETSLDFSHVKQAAYGLLQKRRQIFSLNSNNALLEFLLEGTPMVKEHLLDSRKEVDRQLKSSCETFIKDATEILAAPIIAFIQRFQSFTPAEQLRKQPWATPEQVGVVVKDTQRRIKTHLAPVQRSMQLYLANKETEFILFRHIRNNVVSYFIQMDQILTNANYSSDDVLIVSCPTPEQVSVFISSASLVSNANIVEPYGKTARKVSTLQKPPLSAVTTNEETLPGVGVV